MEVAPPSYTANVPPDGPPPAYTFPTTFTIGTGKTQAPLVTPEQLKGHLGLLRLFYNLRETVEAGKDERLPDWARELEPERRWAWFVNLAAERYVGGLQRKYRDVLLSASDLNGGVRPCDMHLSTNSSMRVCRQSMLSWFGTYAYSHLV